MRNRWRTYGALVILRLLIAFTSFSIIHPDEHFQNPEIAADLVFDYSRNEAGPLKTWEWLGNEPCRSIAPVWISSGVAFKLVKAIIGNNPSAKTLFYAERLAMFCLSLLIDISLYLTSRSYLSLLLFASSPSTLTFLVRPFSNSIETLTLALTLYLTSRVIGHKQRYLWPIGGILAFGVWTRITFVAFAAPSAVAVIPSLYQPTGRASSMLARLLSTLKRGSPALISFLLTAYSLALVDTLYFSSNLSFQSLVLHPSKLVLTPYNLLKYNSSSSNLAEHGLHPRWLHAFVNLPMLFGVGLFVVGDGVRREWRDGGKETKDRKERWMYRLLLASFFVPLLALSIQPHQEPRFLVPLLIPLVLLASHSSFLTSPRRTKKRRIFWSLWIVHSLLFTTLFGYSHQAGLLPTLFRLYQELQDSNSLSFAKEEIDLVFWKTFMPPRHLLLPVSGDAHPNSSSRRINEHDLGGIPYTQLISTLSSLIDTSSPSHSTSPSHATFLITPSYLFNPSLPPSSADKLCFDPQLGGSTFGAHVDIDRLGEMLGTGWERWGVGVWQVKGEC
ncbi:hypothetical protein JCM5353_000129 [Sporobolomyces roseus]